MGKELSSKEKALIRFMVVDDMIGMRRTIKNMLRQLGFEHIIEAEDGLDAWKKLPTAKIDIAIVDWNMPQMTGVELLKKVRADERFAKLPFIMVTAEVDENTIAEAAETEVDAYIIKPFVAKVLEEKINTVLEKKENPSPVDTLLSLVKVLAGAGQFNRAIDQLKVALNISSSNPQVYLAFGDLYNQRGMLDDAEKAYKKAITLEARFTKAYDGLADVYEKKGDVRKSIQTMQNAVGHSTRNASRQTKLGKALLEQGMVKEAQAAFESAIKTEPDNMVMQSEIAESFLAKDMDNEAATLFQSVLRANPKDINIYNRLGIAYRKQGKFREAIEEYKKALAVDPGDENLYYNLGRALMEAKKVDEAIVQFNKALQIYPDFKEAREALDKIINRK
ncbi:MAG TPA: tetratricopeptide repeat protein [Syntrophales bacterium]|nr:tetratricopeptide repeat protein [Syntrophales bacterium]